MARKRVDQSQSLDSKGRSKLAAVKLNSSIVSPSSTPQRARIRVVRLPHGKDLPLPAYQTRGAAGMDLIAAVPADAPIVIKRFARALIPTGLILELPQNTEAQVRPRSGLAARLGVTVLNAPGTIDCDYRGEVQVLLINLGTSSVTIQRGERIAQLVVQPVLRAALAEVRSSSKTARGAGGFGSTGISSKALHKSSDIRIQSDSVRGSKKTNPHK
jgi:dUTP pyrophosphatase